MLMFKIAFRNIFRQKRRTILTALSMFGGFFLAAFFIGFSDGSYGDIINMFTKNEMGHIQIHEKTYLNTPSIYKTINDYGSIERILKNTKGIQNYSPRVYSSGIVSVGEKSTGAKIIGIEAEKENLNTNFYKKIKEGKKFSPQLSNEVMVGKGLQKILKAKPGEDLVIVTQGADGSIANDKYKIVGIIDSGNEISDRISLYMPIGKAQELLTLGNKIHEVVITVNSLKKVLPVAEKLKSDLSATDLSVEPWQIFAKSFYNAMKADQQGMWIMLLIIVLVVAVGVLNTVLMSVLERRKEYGVLKAVGTNPMEIIKLILYEVNILAVICIILGSVLALAVNYWLSNHGIKLPQAFSYGGMKFEVMRTEINLRSFIIPAVTVLISATFVSIFPAIKAAKTDPARAMRQH